jgi:hypothetical protein
MNMNFKIYDCFPFYNELDLLELRLHTLYEHVDHFVLVEADTTYTSRSKPFYFEENRQRFAPFLDKIIHIKVTDMPHNPDAWVNDIYQRNQIARGFTNVADNDLVLVSDLDEIIRPAAVKYMAASGNQLFALRMPLFNFRFNYMRSVKDPYVVWGMAGRGAVVKNIQPDAFRALRFKYFSAPLGWTSGGQEVVEHAGWHFGYMGDNKWLVDKAQSFAHQEINYPAFVNNIDVNTSIKNRQHWGNFGEERYSIVELDDYFPEYLVQNQLKYADWILPDAEAKVFDILPRYDYN